MNSIEKKEKEIIEDFEIFENDMESKLLYLMDLGKKLPILNDCYKTDENKIKGCQSQVWVIYNYDDEKMYITADSNTETIKGLLYLIITLFSGESPEHIHQHNISFFEKIGMSQFISSQRTNGLYSIIKQIKHNAFIYQQTKKTL